MSVISWGYDCAISTLSTLPGAPVDDFITAQRAPAAFAGRYLVDIPGLSDGLTAAEVASLHGRGRAILPVYNRTSSASIQGTFQGGWNAGQEAVNLAYSLGVPHGTQATAIYIDIEAGWQPTSDYLHGYMANVHRAGYTPGVYMNTQDPTQVTPYLAVRALGVPGVVWASEPEPTADAGVVLHVFEPATALLGDHAGDTVLWQFRENEFPQYDGGLFDMDTCTARGLTLMWGRVPTDPFAVAGTVCHILTKSAIKQQPTHPSKTAIGPDHKPVPALLPGTEVITKGEVSGDWAAFRLPAPSPVWGWLLTASVKI